MKATPMTRRALRQAIPARVRVLLVTWFSDRTKPFPRELKRRGYARLPDAQHGVERVVVVGPRVVIKTMGWRTSKPAWSECYRRSRVLAPTIRLAESIIAQPRGRVLGSLKHKQRARLERKTDVCERLVQNKYAIGDIHDHNLAVFPDGTVRAFDY